MGTCPVWHAHTHDMGRRNEKYGENRIRRAFTYKALNKLIQGSAADMTKKSMLDLYKEGIVAHIQIHDELDISVESDKEAKRIIEIMETAVDLEVPNKVLISPSLEAHLDVSFMRSLTKGTRS